MIYTVITSKSTEGCHQEMEEIQSKAIQKYIKRYIMNSWITQEQVSVILRLG